MVRSSKVLLTLKINENVAVEAAEAVLMRSNPHASTLVDNILTEKGITRDNLTKYFVMLGQVTAEFWESAWNPQATSVLKSHEVRGLFLPLVYSVIFASIGNCSVGNYEYQILATRDAGHSVDKKWILEFSAKLESVRQYVKGDVGQIGNYGAQPQTPVMLSILGEVSSDARTANLLVRDGHTVDTALAGFSALVGLSLVAEANSILYTGIEEVNFRQLLGTIAQKE